MTESGMLPTTWLLFAVSVDGLHPARPNRAASASDERACFAFIV